MAEENIGPFKGIKQVLADSYNETVDKKGYLWFVRKSADATSGDIYFGTRHYGHFDEDEIKNLTLTEDITTMGVTVGALNNGSTLKSGSTLTDVLKQILIKEIDVVASKPSVSISMTGANNGGSYEVGTELNIALVAKFTDGRFKGADTDQYSYDEPAQCQSGATTYYKDSVALTDNTDVLLVDGEKSYKYNCVTAYGASTFTPVKNNGNASTVKIDAGECKSGILTVNGKYYGYVGYLAKTVAGEITSDDIKTLNAKKTFLDGTTTLVDTTAIKSNGKSIVIAVPSTYKLASIANGVGADIKPNFSSEGTVTYTNGTVNTDYSVYVYPITNGAEVEFKNLVISK